MTIKFNFLDSKKLKNAKNYALFCDEKFTFSAFLNLSNKVLISDLIQNNKANDKKILQINLNKNQNLLVIKLKKIKVRTKWKVRSWVLWFY